MTKTDKEKVYELYQTVESTTRTFTISECAKLLYTKASYESDMDRKTMYLSCANLVETLHETKDAESINA